MRIVIALFLISTSILQAHENAFYALSSLCCHLNQLNMQHAEDPIEFSEMEVENLWNAASIDNNFLSDIELARHYYNDLSYSTALQILDFVWEQFNDEILEADILFPKSFYTYPNFSDNPLIPDIVRKKTFDYLLPLDSPLKPIMDSLFAPTRANENEESLVKAGFSRLDVKATSKLSICRHDKLSGYLIKMYLENVRPNKHKEGWEWLLQRCEGADAVRKLIKKKKMKHFCAPEKWLYPLPPEPAPPPTSKNPELFVLLVQDMNIVSLDESNYIWKNKITKSVLKELFCILSHGLASTCVVLNEPPTKDGKFACIDTEHPKRRYDYSVVRPYLSDEMAAYWSKLVKSGGK